MKRWIALLLALGMLLSLCACGETEEATPVEQPEETPSPAALVEQQIGALGVIGLDSKDAVEAAEAAWAALSPAEQAEVHNYAVLQAARLVYDDAAAKQAEADAEAAYAAAMEPFVGTWVVECPGYDQSFDLRADGTYLYNAYTASWSADPASGSLNIDGYRWIVFEEDGFSKIRPDGETESHACVLEQDLIAARECKYVSVELTAENARNYFSSDPILVGYKCDDWGNVIDPTPYYFYVSPDYELGLVWVTSQDAGLQFNGSGVGWTAAGGQLSCPGGFHWGRVSLTGNAKGTFWYTKASYVLDKKLQYSSNSWNRVLILTSGEVFVSKSDVYGKNYRLENGYDDLTAFYEDHKY